MKEPSLSCELPSIYETKLAEQIVRARLDARVFPKYPANLPSDFDSAYRCQNLAIDLWPEPIAGWKVSMFLTPEWQAECGEERFIGPAFAPSIRITESGRIVECPVIPGGWPGIEPELVVSLAKDTPGDKLEWTIEEAAELIGKLHLGAEIVSSALPGPDVPSLAADVADFGLNFGIVAGSEIRQWRNLDEVQARCYIDGKLEASGVTRLMDRAGALGGLAFALGQCARLRRPARAGTFIATGTITRYHALHPGQSARLIFDGLGEVECHAVQAEAYSRIDETRSLAK